MAVKKANTYTPSQVAALAKLQTTPLKDVNKFQADRTKANVRDANVQTNLQNRAISTLNKGYAANPGAYMNAAKKLNVDLAKVNPTAYAAQQRALVKPTAKTLQQKNAALKMQYQMSPPDKAQQSGVCANLTNINAQKLAKDRMRMAKGMAKGGVAASKMGAVKTASPSRDGVASKGKTKGTNLGNSGKNVGIMRGARRTK